MPIVGAGSVYLLDEMPGCTQALHDLHDDAVWVLDMEPKLHIRLWRQALLVQVFGDGVPVEVLDADREMIDDAPRTLVAKGRDRLLDAETEDLIRLVLAHRGHAEDGAGAK
jgi:hypothetical protein